MNLRALNPGHALARSTLNVQRNARSRAMFFSFHSLLLEALGLRALTDGISSTAAQTAEMSSCP